MVSRTAFIAAQDAAFAQQLGVAEGKGNITGVVDLFDEQVEGALKEREGKKLLLIMEARARIREGTYGVCKECDKKIPLARLEAHPLAMHCVPCQQQVDASGDFGTSRESKSRNGEDFDGGIPAAADATSYASIQR